MGRTDTASRVIQAPLAAVFAALVDPEALVRWLPPSGMTGRFDYFDGHAGGSYRMVLTYDRAPAAGGKSDQNSDVTEGRFIDVAPDERVVQAIDFRSDDPSFRGTMTMTWSVAATDGGTRVDMRADNVPPGISAEDHEEGMTSSLANLAVYMAERGSRPGAD